MKKIIIYTTSSCPYCARAKSLLNSKNIPFEEVNVEDQEAREKMTQKAGGKRTVPQIFIDDESIGGFDDLSKLDQSGKLDDMIKA